MTKNFVCPLLNRGARDLIAVLQEAKQEINPDLEDLARMASSGGGKRDRRDFQRRSSEGRSFRRRSRGRYDDDDEEFDFRKRRAGTFNTRDLYTKDY